MWWLTIDWLIIVWWVWPFRISTDDKTDGVSKTVNGHSTKLINSTWSNQCGSVGLVKCHTIHYEPITGTRSRDQLWTTCLLLSAIVHQPQESILPKNIPCGQLVYPCLASQKHYWMEQMLTQPHAFCHTEVKRPVTWRHTQPLYNHRYYITFPGLETDHVRSIA